MANSSYALSQQATHDCSRGHGFHTSEGTPGCSAGTELTVTIAAIAAAFAIATFASKRWLAVGCSHCPLMKYAFV